MQSIHLFKLGIPCEACRHLLMYSISFLTDVVACVDDQHGQFCGKSNSMMEMSLGQFGQSESTFSPHIWRDGQGGKFEGNFIGMENITLSHDLEEKDHGTRGRAKKSMEVTEMGTWTWCSKWYCTWFLLIYTQLSSNTNNHSHKSFTWLFCLVKGFRFQFCLTLLRLGNAFCWIWAEVCMSFRGHKVHNCYINPVPQM